jgi:hypothetical protein
MTRDGGCGSVQDDVVTIDSAAHANLEERYAARDADLSRPSISECMVQAGILG